MLRINVQVAKELDHFYSIINALKLVQKAMIFLLMKINVFINFVLLNVQMIVPDPFMTLRTRFVSQNVSQVLI